MSRVRFAVLKRLFNDSLTSANGDYDPARIVNYLFLATAGLAFIALFTYVTIKNGSFDGANFVLGVGGISGAMLAAAAGVKMKASTEVPVDPPQAPTGPVVPQLPPDAVQDNPPITQPPQS